LAVATNVEDHGDGDLFLLLLGLTLLTDRTEQVGPRVGLELKIPAAQPSPWTSAAELRFFQHRVSDFVLRCLVISIDQGLV
jgi:hypothetical protein